MIPKSEDVPNVHAIAHEAYQQWVADGAEGGQAREKGWLGFEWIAVIAPGGGQSHWKTGHPLVEFLLKVCGVSVVYSVDLKMWTGRTPLEAFSEVAGELFPLIESQGRNDMPSTADSIEGVKKKAVVMGYSTGGMLLSLLWSRCSKEREAHFDSESMLLLMGTQMRFTSEVVKHYVWDFWDVEYQRKDPKRLAFLRQQHGSDEVWEAVVKSCRVWFEDDSDIFMSDEELRKLFSPTSRAFLVTGEYDSSLQDSTFFMTGEGMLHVCPAARVLVVPGFSHFDYFAKGTTNWKGTMLAFHYFLTLYTKAGQARLKDSAFVSRL